MVARMSIFAGRLGLAIVLAAVLAALCPGGRAAHAQAAPVSYWIPGWPMGFGPGSDTYGNVPSFDARGGASYPRYNFPNGWFVGGEGGGLGLSTTGFNQMGAFGNSLYYEGVQFGYNFKNANGLPLTFHAGFDTLKYNSGIGGPFTPFDNVSGTLPAIARMRASNISLRRMSACRSTSATPSSPAASTATSTPSRCRARRHSPSPAVADAKLPGRRRGKSSIVAPGERRGPYRVVPSGEHRCRA